MGQTVVSPKPGDLRRWLQVGVDGGEGMSDGQAPGASDGSETPEHVPTVRCSRCSREWQLDVELDEHRAGNRAVELFALDHERHTGHFPDDVRPWVVDCQRCPAGDGYLAEQPARRWAETHARHTGHAVEVRPPTDDGSVDVIDGG